MTNNQTQFIEKIRSMNEGKRKKYHISTFGCQMNAHDSEKLSHMYEQMGYERADGEDDADIVTYNTCCVRENAENRVYGNLGYLKHLKENGRDIKVVLCGCMTQQGAIVEKIKKSYTHTDIIIGTYNLFRLPELLLSSIEGGGMIIDIWDEHRDADNDLPAKRESRFKASVNIMYGCNNFCSYCIVPYVRGRERSRPAEDILIEVRGLAADGVKEIILLGQNVNSYLGGGSAFAGLLRSVSEIEGIKRVRFMTSHPKDLSDELIAEIRDNPVICKSVHLPVQSGSSRVLGEMNRKYTKESYLALVGRLREAVPGIAITTDIIVGFPGETEEDFQETLDIVRRVKYAGAYTFLYSKRGGTPAADMDAQIDEKTAKERFGRLLAALNLIVHEESGKMLGRIENVLAEGVNKGIATGRTDNNMLVHFEADDNVIGSFVELEITENKTFYLMGKMTV